MNAAAEARGNDVVPTKIATASWRGMLCDATTIATANEKTMPRFANVRSRPAVTPRLAPGAAFITAAVLAGKKRPDPIAPTT